MNQQKVKFYDNEATMISIGSTLLQVENCFSESTLGWLDDVTNNSGNEFFVHPCQHRLQLKTSCSDQSKLDQIGESMTVTLSKLTGIDLAFTESKYWLDLPLFGSSKHADSEFLVVNFQIYISSGLYSMTINPVIPEIIRHFIGDPETYTMARGAKFYHVDPPYEIPFRPNVGYININTDKKIHDVSFSVDCRRSVMFQYARV